MIGRLRRVLSVAFGRADAPAAGADVPAGQSPSGGGVDEPAQRIEAARRRLKATIPPPPED